MKTSQWLFVVIVLICGGLIVAMLLSSSLSGIETHPSFNSMTRSGEPAFSITLTKWVSLFFGLCIVLFLSLLLVLSFQDSVIKQNRKLARTLLLLGLCYVSIYLTMVITYWNYEASLSEIFWLGFPAPTALMLFGMAPVPLLFTYFFIRNFDRHIYPEASEKAFEELVKQAKPRD